MAFDGKVGHLEAIESPWFNAGGVIKTIEDVEVMAKTGVGAIEDGSHCLLPRHGNDAVIDEETGQIIKGVKNTYYYDEQENATYNSLGMPGPGMDKLEEDLKERIRIAHAHGKKYILNVAPVTSDPVSESVELVSRGYQHGVDAVLLNAGCPNVINKDGSRKELLSRNPKALGKVLTALAELDTPPLFLRISPQESYSHTYRLAGTVALAGNVSAIFTPNTWPGYTPTRSDGSFALEVEGNAGGRSGPAMAPKARVQTRWANTAFSKQHGIDVVSSSSIMTASEMKVRLDVGAYDAKACAGTTFFYESQNGWAQDVDRLLNEYGNLEN